MTPFYLKFTDSNQLQSVLYTNGASNYQNIDIIGTIMNNKVNPPVPYEGYYCNVLALDCEDINTLLLYSVNPTPSKPSRVWAS